MSKPAIKISETFADEAGIDVSHLVGDEQDTPERRAFEAYREAFAVATSHPSVPNFRACVTAYDEFLAIFCGGDAP
jgi:hypothetical protein